MNRDMRVAVTSRSFSRHPELREELLAVYPDTRFNNEGVSLVGGALRRFLEDRDAAIVALEPIDAALLAALPELKILSKYGVGLDNVDLVAAARHGIRVGWTAGVNARSVAELVIANAIGLLRRIPQANDLVRGGGWHQITGRELSACVVGIIGCGHVGKAVARLLQPFGCRILAHDIQDYADFNAGFGVEPVGLEDLLTRAEVVTLHLPLTARTRGLLDRSRLELMRRDAVLINTARGGLVDETALKELLETGRIAGAAFDVFQVEPPRNKGLLDLPNFLATPHIGGSSVQAILAMGRAAISGLDRAEDPMVHFAAIGGGEEFRPRQEY